MSSETLLTQLDAGVLTVTINRPEVKNAFDTATQRRMTELFYDAARTPAVRVLVLTGTGRAFSTGGDVKSLGGPDPGDPIAQQYSADPSWSGVEARTDRLRKMTEASVWLYKMGKPTIAMMRGPAAGAGLSLALACDFRFAADNAFFVTAFARIGMSGDYGGSYFMTKLIGPMKTKELYMLSERVSAEEASRLGLITRLTKDDELETQTYAFARRLASGPAIALRYIKDNVHSALDESLEHACETEMRNMIRCRMTADSQEAIKALNEKREPALGESDMALRRAAIVAPLRTPVGTFGGSLRTLPVEALGAAVVRAILEKTRVDPALIEDVIFAQSYANGETPCTGRWVALEAGLPVTVPGMQLDRRCGGGLQAVVNAAMMVQSGAADVVLAGGVESMSNVEYYTTDMRWGVRAGSVKLHDRLERGRERSQPEARFGRISGMIETAENLATQYGISREQSDEYAARSQQRAAQAQAANRFAEEIVPLTVAQKKGEPLVINRDEGVRPETTLTSLGALRPLIKGGTVTAGNSSQQNDAAAACLVVAESELARLKLEPLGFLVGWAAAGCEPATMGIGPVPATAKLLKRTGLSFEKLDLVELNEAFACQVLSVLKGWNWDDAEKLNVNGSGISLGHPIAATGVRMLTTLLHELKRRGGRFGLETMCIGGGQGLAAIFERA